MGRTLLDKIWDAHTVRVEDGGRCVLYIDRQYIHGGTSPVAFAGIERRGFGVARPAQITATADHNIPTVDQHLPIGRSRRWPGTAPATVSSTSAWDTPGRVSCTSSAPSWDSPSRA
mgnify:CR=1 FL=1